MHDVAANEASPTSRPLAWPEITPAQGALRLRFRVEGIEDTWSLATRARGETTQVILADTPVVQLNLNVTRQKTTVHLMFPAARAENGPWVQSELGGLHGLLRERPAEQIKFGGLDLARLRGDRSYELLVAWDLDARTAQVFLNGVLQGDVFPGNKGDWIPAPREGVQALAGGRLRSPDASIDVPVSIELAEVVTGAISETRAATLAADLPALEGEGRADAGGALDLTAYRLTPWRGFDLAEARLVQEAELFGADGRRVRSPAGHEWVLEGPGAAEKQANGWRIETGGSRTATAARGAVVLWTPGDVPDRVLVEYDFAPENARRGLHILFWSALGADGRSIFSLERRRRDGVFGEYLWHGLNSYHASLFATDDDTPRRVANLRKNDGFVLVACGDDRIAGGAPGPFRVRLLKDGARMAVEVDGRTVLHFVDDGRANGPALGAGRIGFRLMAHTGSAEITGLRIWTLDPR